MPSTRRLIVLCVALLWIEFLPLSALAATPVDGLREWLAQADRPPLADQPFAAEAVTKDQAAEAGQLLWADHVATFRRDRAAEWKGQSITVGGDTLKLLGRRDGKRPAGGWNLFISMHGGGNAPAEVNDQQWQNQIRLYDPPDSLVIAPRAPTNDWDLWHKPHVDVLFDRLIQDAVALGGADVNRVYLMGYSAGGDGVYQLAPRMADRFAAASMMAGHPNDASPLGLRDLPFTLHVGALDDGYGRNAKATEWGQKLDGLAKADPKGYAHWVKLHDGKHHWMDRDDREALPWMMRYARDPLPAKVVWMQSNVTHDRFYWLATPADQAKGGQLAVVSHDGQHFDVEKVGGGLRTLTVLLNDKLVDPDQPVTVTLAGKPLSIGPAKRTIGRMAHTLDERGDPDGVFSAAVTVTVGG